MIEIANATGGIVHVALYKRSPLRPEEPPVAWAVVSPPPLGRAIFSVPRDYRVFARYSFSPEDPWQPVYQTNILTLRRNYDSLACQEVSLGRSAWGGILARNVRDAGPMELRIENHFSTGVWCHVQCGENDVYLPRLLPPHEALIEALVSPFCLAVVSPLARVGAPLVEHEIRRTEVELATGKREVFTIYDTPIQGYRITLGAPPLAERKTQPKEITKTRRAKPKKAPRIPQKQSKTQAKPKAAAKKKREAAKKHSSRKLGRGKTKSAFSSLLPPSSDESQASA